MRTLLVEDESPAGAPEWAVTFGDLMSLLLTCFILLVSMSEIKKNDRFQGIADSIQQQFGRDALSGLAGGGLHPRNSELATLAVTGRELRQTFVRDEAAKPDTNTEPRVRLIRAGERTTIGTVLYFQDDSTTLTDEHRAELQAIVGELRGKPQKIEIRGHTSRKAPQPSERIQDNWDLAYDRCRQTLAYLVTELRIDPSRIRLCTAAANEPAATAPELRGENPRVEVFLLEEVAE